MTDQIYDLHLLMRNNEIVLAYSGEFTQEITKSVLAMTEKNLESVGEEGNIKRKVFKVMVECLQNIVKHSEENKEKFEERKIGEAIFLIGKGDECYNLITGNYIQSENTESVKEKLEQVNNLDKDGLKQLYKEVIKNGQISDKGGAGLGFIDMARKSENKLEYNFIDENNGFSFFVLQTKINR